MEIQGKVIAVLPERSGVSARGEWKLKTYVIETQEQYPKKMAFDVFGADRIENFGIHLGEVINVSFDIDAHEYQGRYFNQIRAWNVTKVSQQATSQAQSGMAQQSAPYTLHAQHKQPQSTAPSSDPDNLPF
ncbi:MAG: DUF3127 domain-containing protein [Segatella copri]